jgi:hypothetical protein
MTKFISIFLCLFTLLVSQERYAVNSDLQMLLLSDKFANSVIGVVELTGNNDGTLIEEMQRVGGGRKGQPYCYYYQYWAFWKAKYHLDNECKSFDIPIPKGGLAQLPFNYAKANGVKTNYYADKHDLIVWKTKDSWTGHIERVKEVKKNGWVLTYAGNTHNGLQGNQREGNGIFIRKRNISHPLSRTLLIRGIVGYVV